MPFSSVLDFEQSLKPFVVADNQRLIVRDVYAFRKRLIDEIVENAVFGSDEIRRAARGVIWSASQTFGCGAASIRGLVRAIARDEVSQNTIPEIALRGITYDIARAIFRAAKTVEAGAILFSLASCDLQFTHQRPDEYSACVLAAAVKEGWNMPVLLQGCCVRDSERPEAFPTSFVREAVPAGFFNFTIDAGDHTAWGSTAVHKISRVIEEIGPLNIDISLDEIPGETQTGTRSHIEARIDVALEACIYGHAEFPAKLRDGIDAHLRDSGYLKGALTETDIEKNRWRGFGPFKSEIWNVPDPEKKQITADLEAKLVSLFDRMVLRGTSDMVRRHIIPMPVEKKTLT